MTALSQQSVPTVDAVETELGMGAGGWDMVGPENLIAAVLKCAAACTAPAAQPDIEGWKLVPIEPTPEMLQADWNVTLSDAHTETGVAECAWAAMLAASPTPPQALQNPAEGALREAVERTIDVIERQLSLIGERAPGDYLDKRPVTQSLRAHIYRLSNALAAAPTSEKDARDAARYRHLRNAATPDGAKVHCAVRELGKAYSWAFGEVLDSEVDAAIAAMEGRTA